MHDAVPAHIDIAMRGFFDCCATAGKTNKQAAERPSAFSGDLTLDGLRVNQLKLSRNLTGSILLSDEQFLIRAKVAALFLACPCSV